MVGAQVSNADLVIVRFDDNHSVLYGRCLHRGALMADGSVSGDNFICGLHGWDYLFQTGVSSSTAEVAIPVRRRSCFGTISPCPPFPPWPGRGVISTPVGAGTSRS